MLPIKIPIWDTSHLAEVPETCTRCPTIAQRSGDTPWKAHSDLLGVFPDVISPIPLLVEKQERAPILSLRTEKSALCFLRPVFTEASSGKVSYQELPWFGTAYQTRKGGNNSLSPGTSRFVTHRLKQGVSALQFPPKRWQNAQPQKKILRSMGFGNSAPNKQTAGNARVY